MAWDYTHTTEQVLLQVEGDTAGLLNDTENLGRRNEYMDLVDNELVRNLP